MSDQPPKSHIRSLLGLALATLVFAGVWFVFDHLRRSAAMEDCYASGRRDCVTIDNNGAHMNAR